MKRFLLIIGIIGLIVGFVYSGASIIIKNLMYNDTSRVEGLNEYMQWEHDMMKENPDYEDLKILIDISEKTLYLLDGNNLIKKYPIASGKPGSPSPIGSWIVVDKKRMGSGFGTRWMGLNVPWSAYQQECGLA